MTLRSSTNTSMRRWRRHFPLISVDSVVALFEEMIQTNSSMKSFSPSSSLEPNLAFASIILGYIESRITRDQSLPASSDAPLPTRKRPSSSNILSSRAAKRTVSRILSPAPSPVEVPSPDDFLTVQDDDGRSSVSMPSYDFALSPMSVGTEPPKSVFPTLKFEDAEQLYNQFYEMIVHDPKLSVLSRNPVVDSATGASTKCPIPQPSNRDLIRGVCDAICSRLSASLRIRERVGHAQSIYSLLKFGQLDSFGLAYSTVAACQLLGYSDVHLALSEDHAWVEFGPPERRENADVSVMPGMEFLASSTGDSTSPATTLLRPPPVRLEPFLHSWLYLNGCPVVCNPGILSIAAVVAAIQPTKLVRSSVESLGWEQSSSRRSKSKMSTLSTSSDGHSTRIVEGISTELLQLKQRLLWTVYRAGLLDQYPLGLTNLAEIELGYPTPGIQVSDLTSDLHQLPASRYPLSEVVEVHGEGITREMNLHADIPLILLRRAVEINRVFYRNQHVYPYLYLANHHRRRGDAIGALHYWAEAARVIGQYNHSTEDLEIYREFLEIATVVIPDFFRPRLGDVSGPNLLDNPLCMAYLLAFYDHLCLWEEGSAVPVLHVGWVDKLVASLVRFSPAIRTQLHIEATRSMNDDNDAASSSTGSAVLAAKKSRCRPSTTATTALHSAQPVNKTDGSKLELNGIIKNASAQQPLRVILPPPPVASSAGLQSSSTTGSSVLSIFPSGGEVSSSTLPEVVGARSVPESIISASSFIDNLDKEGDDEDNPLDVNRLMSECAAGNTEKVIARLAKASQFRLLNPRFLMGAKNESPFASCEDLKGFFGSTESVNSQRDPNGQENSSKVDMKREKKEESQTAVETLGHSEHQEIDVSTEGEVIGIDIPSSRHLHRISPSPESSICPSLPSIASTPPLPLHHPSFPVAITTTTANDDLESERSEAYFQQPISSQEEQTQLDISTKSESGTTAATAAKSPGVYLRLYSAKMCRIGPLLNASGPLKTSAINLTLTAQSEVDIGRRGRLRGSSASTSWNRMLDGSSAPATE